MNTMQLAEKIADRLMFITGINRMGTLLTPSIPSNTVVFGDEIKGGSYCREEVVREIESILRDQVAIHTLQGLTPERLERFSKYIDSLSEPNVLTEEQYLGETIGKLESNCPHCGNKCSTPDRTKFDHDVQGQFYCENCQCGFDNKTPT